MKKAVVYVNQFFGQIGGEEFAGHQPEIREGQVGPAMLYNQLLDGEVSHTVICGDNYMGSNQEQAVKAILGFLEKIDFDIFFAGPSFQAGRYGAACGVVCQAVKEKFGVPVITSMHQENPGVEMFKKQMPIFIGGHSAAKLKNDVTAMVSYGNKILRGEPLLPADEEGYFARGIRFQYAPAGMKTAAERAVDMLIKKAAGQPFESEFPIPKVDRVPIAEPVADLSKATVALVTSGGVVPVGNPDRIQSASATRWGQYSMAGMERLENREADAFMTIHAGYDPAAGDADPNRIVPLDAMRAYEKEGKIGKVFDRFFTTVGTGTTQAEAARMGQEITAILKKEKVDAVVLTAT